jgi:hypothetical protein
MSGLKHHEEATLILLGVLTAAALLAVYVVAVTSWP